MLKITVEKAGFARAMGFAAQIVQAKSTIPILTSAKIEADGDALRISTTDMDQFVTVSVPAQCRRSGTITVPAKQLAQIVATLADGAQIEFDHNDGSTTVKSGRSQWELPSYDPADFPEIKAANGSTMSLPGAALIDVFGRIGFAMSTDATKFHLNGIHLGAQSDVVRACATNGLQLARVILADAEVAKVIGGFERGIIIPRESIPAMRKIAAEAGIVSIMASGTLLTMTADDVVYTTKLVDGTFPDYDRIIPQASAVSATVDRAALAVAIKRVSLAAEERTRCARFSFSSHGIRLETANAVTGSSATEDVEAEISGELVTGFNTEQLAGIIGAIGDCKSVCFQMGKPMDPVVIHSSDDLQGCKANRLFLLAPLHVRPPTTDTPKTIGKPNP